MKLLVTTPAQTVIASDGVDFISASDETGSFAICSGHADFLTRLTVSVLTWRDAQRQERYVALRGGVLRVTGGGLVEVATMEAKASDSLAELQDRLVELFRQRDREDDEERAAANRLHSAAIRQIQRVLRASRETMHSEAIPRPRRADPTGGEES